MLTTVDLFRMKEERDKISMVTAYDYPSAKQVEKAEADIILVGDSLGMVVLGYNSTTEVTLDDMIHHSKAVKRGAPNTFMVVDMPFMSYHASIEQSINNVTKLFQASGAQAVKIEGRTKDTVSLIEQLSDGGIPVMGHLGLTPQLVNIMGGFRVQGRDEKARKKIINDATALTEAGAVAIILEGIPADLGKEITDLINIPTIGIGAGVHCDGQVLVYHDMLMYGADRFPKFVKNYGDFDTEGVKAISQYVKEVKDEQFPTKAHTYNV